MSERLSPRPSESKEGVTVDANVIKAFNDDYARNVDSTERVLIERIARTIGFVVDVGGKIKHQWFDLCRSVFLQEWYVANLYHGVIREVSPKNDARHRKKLVNDLGFPAKGFDLDYIFVANAGTTRYILTEDMDFFDPSLKLADDKAKMRAKHERKGAVCRYLSKEMDICVGTASHAYEDLFSPSP